MIAEVESVLANPRKSAVKLIYKKVFSKDLNSECGSCISDAKIELAAWLKEQQRMNSKINLFINRYQSENQERQKELDLCYQLNKDNKFIDNIIDVEGRGYDDFFGQFTDDVNIIANSDIFFDETIELAKKIKPFEMWCLTRWDYANGKANFLNRADSQDVWIVRGKVKKVKAGFNLGVPGCDNRIAYNFKQAGYIVRNPSLSIRAIHYHLTNFRTYRDKDRLPEPYLLVTPCLI